MLFNSWQFAVFFPSVFLLYYAIPHRFRWLLLLVSSYYFYMSWDAQLVWLIAAVTLISYSSACVIELSSKPRIKKLALVAAVVSSMGMLFFYKYFNFFSDSVTAVLRAMSLPVSPVTLELILPVGISFYTFQALSYVIDVYRGALKAERHLGIYALYVSFFPQLVAGPIERSTNLLPQFYEKHEFQYDQAVHGLKIMAIGFFKKLIVADYVAGFADEVFSNLPSYTGFSLLAAAFLFSIQIYCDFSGYSDIAVGSAELMGFRLMKNFDAPYFSRSVKEFWRRWHISLSSWLMDYVYIPLGGSRVARPRHYFNLMITFLFSGLWHGANWTFVIWGALHGLYLVAGNYTQAWRHSAWRALRIDEQSRPAIFLKVLCTFALVSGAFVIFRANSVSDLGYIAGHFLEGAAQPLRYVQRGLNELGIGKVVLARLAVSLGILWALDFFGRRGDPIEKLSRWPLAARWTVYVLCVALMVVFAPNGAPADFIYFQF